MKKNEPREVVIPSREEVAREREKLRNRSRFRRNLFSTLGFLAVVAAVAVLISTQFFPVIQVSGDSMEPLLEDGRSYRLLLSEQDTSEACDRHGRRLYRYRRRRKRICKWRASG